jgi:sigma-E factor negative regulatory protein RseC
MAGQGYEECTMVQTSDESVSFIKEEGIVESISQRKAVVRIQKGAQCKNCSSREGCGVSGGREMQIDLENELGAKVGDYVEISLPTRSLMKLSLLVYLLPVLALIVGAYLGRLIGTEVLQSHSAVISVICGAVAMGAAIFGLRWFDRRVQVSSGYRPRMTRILFNVSTSGAADSK